MLAFLRAPHPPRTNNAGNNPIIYENGTSKMEFHPPSERAHKYIMTHTVPPTDPHTKIPSIIQPPFHYHIHQSEKFLVTAGIGNFYIGLDPAPTYVLSASSSSSSSSKPRAGAGVAAQRYHRFENASATETLVVDIQLDTEDYENEVRFFRNFFGYLDDCKTAAVAPSLFQLIVFLNSADTPLALPLPNERVGVWVSWVFMVIVAAWGRWVLGYRENYDEYYVGGTGDKKMKTEAKKKV